MRWRTQIARCATISHPQLEKQARQSNHVYQDRDVVGRTACDHEQVPDPVRVGETRVERIEDDPDGVEESACSQPCESSGAQRLKRLEEASC